MLLSIVAFAAGIIFDRYALSYVLAWFSKEEPVVAAAVTKIVVTKAPAPPTPPTK